MPPERTIKVLPLTKANRWFDQHRRSTLLLMFVVFWTTPVLLALNWDHKFIFIPLELGTKFLIFYPALRANCRWFGPVVTRFRTEKKAVWLTIDDGPHPEDTPQLLELLKKHNARATFFVIGRRVQKHPELARAILHDGHTLANHTQTHPALHFWSYLAPRFSWEIDQCARSVHAATGEAPRWFRAPAGMANPVLHFLLRDRGMPLIGWSARGFDGLLNNTDAMSKRICNAIQPGAIILLHEGRRDRLGRPINLILAESVLKRLSAEGYEFIAPEEADFL